MHPYSAFNFLVDWIHMDGGTCRTGFHWVYRLDNGISVGGYRAGSSNGFNAIKMQGWHKYADFVLNRRIVVRDAFLEWLSKL